VSNPTHGPTVGVWLSRAELMALPTSGSAWDRLKAQADAGPGTPVDLSCQDSKHSTATMAVALVAARLDSSAYKDKVRAAIAAIIGTESGSSCGHGDRNRILGVGRNLAAYVIAADLIDLRSYDPTLESRFRTWLSALRTKPPTAAYPTLTLANGDATDAGNWGAYEGASRAAAAVYLADTADIARSADALRHFLTDGTGFTWSGDTSWACDPAHPTPINGSCSRDGHSLDGVIPMDMRRGGSYQWPPLVTQYPRENLVGRTIQAEILWRAGYATYDWGSHALLRASERLVALDALDPAWYEPDIHAYWLIRSHLGVLRVTGPSDGRGVSGVDWTHG
jgi:hypothetical protein